MDWATFFTGAVGALFGTAIGSSVAGLLLKSWLDHRFTIERTRQQEERQFALKRREASIAVTEILGEWVRSNYTGEPTNDDLWKLQTTYWRNIMLLDRELLLILLPALGHQPGAVSANEIIVQARRVLLGLSEPDITANGLNNWPPATHKPDG